MKINWQSVTTRPATHHASKITEEQKGVRVTPRDLKDLPVYEFKFGEAKFLTRKTSVLNVGDWVVNTEKGFEYFSAEEFKRFYIESSNG